MPSNNPGRKFHSPFPAVLSRTGCGLDQRRGNLPMSSNAASNSLQRRQLVEAGRADQQPAATSLRIAIVADNSARSPTPTGLAWQAH